MCNHNEAHFFYEDGYFLYHCPTCGLAEPRGRRAREAKRGWRTAARDGRTYRCGAKPRPVEELRRTVPRSGFRSSSGIAVDVPLAAESERRCEP